MTQQTLTQNNAPRNDQRQTALITGASGGIGLELAKVFAADHFDLILVARTEAALRDLADQLTAQYHTQNIVIPADLTQVTAPNEIMSELDRRGVTIDVLVNNAGFAAFGYFDQIDTMTQLKMIELNVLALTHLTRLLLPGMKARHQGKVLNVASTASFQPGPLMAVYYATKAYVLSLSEALAEELRGSGVTVTALCPGPTESGFQRRAAMENSRILQGGLAMMSSVDVARIGYEATMRGQRIVIPGFRNQLLALSPRFSPRRVVTRIVMNMQRETSH